MTLQSSGAISMNNIESEFDDQGSLGYGLTSYYGKTRGLPTSGAISYNDFHGKNAFCRFTCGEWVDFIYTNTGFQFLVAGSIPESGDNNFSNGSNTATVAGIYHSTFNNGPVLELSGTNSNSNSTFKTLKIYGSSTLTLSRSSATYTANTPGSGTNQWYWSNTSKVLFNGGTYRIALEV